MTPSSYGSAAPGASTHISTKHCPHIRIRHWNMKVKKTQTDNIKLYFQTICVFLLSCIVVHAGQMAADNADDAVNMTNITHNNEFSPYSVHLLALNDVVTCIAI